MINKRQGESERGAICGNKWEEGKIESEIGTQREPRRDRKSERFEKIARVNKKNKGDARKIEETIRK